MVRNIRGGNKAKKQKSNATKTNNRPLYIIDKSINANELYGQVNKRLGGNPPQLQVLCEDGEERRCTVRGKFNKRVWINQGDIIVILYDKESSSLIGEVSYKYDQNEVMALDRLGVFKNCKFLTGQDDNKNDLLFTDMDTNEDNSYQNVIDNLENNMDIASNMDILSSDDNMDITQI